MQNTDYVGRTSSFDEYDSFAGLAETVDVGNALMNNNSFVMLDASSDDSAIVENISHEWTTPCGDLGT